MTTIKLPNGWRIWGHPSDYLMARFTTKTATRQGKDVEVEVANGKQTYHGTIAGAVAQIIRELGESLDEAESTTLQELLGVHERQLEATQELARNIEFGLKMMDAQGKAKAGGFLVVGGGVKA